MTGSLSPRALLGIRDFRMLWAGQVVSSFGDALTNLALLLTAQRLTGSTSAVAATAIAIAVPQLTFGLLAGVYVDRWDRKKVMVISDIVRAVLVLGFLLVSSADQMWLLYVVAFLQASIGTFFLPARTAMMPTVVPADGLLGANSLSEMSRIVAGVAGTAAAGLIAGVAGSISPVFWIDAVTFLVSAAAVARITVDASPPATSEQPAVVQELREGLGFVRRSRLLLGVLTGGGVVMLGLGAVNVLLVPFVIDDLAIDEAWFGALELAQVSSMVAAGALLAVLAGRVKPTYVISTGMMAVGAVVAAMALVGNVWHLILLMFAVGWVITPLQASVQTIVQRTVPGDKLGRVGAVLSTVMTATGVVSMAAAGVVAGAIGVRSVFALAGAIAVAAGIATAAVFRGVALPEPPAIEPEPEPALA
ncbi:MAG: MFS transporter [Acidimicrobiia bacterium]